MTTRGVVSTRTNPMAGDGDDLRPGEPSWAGTYRDTLTGFEGRACARTEHLTGVVQICLIDLDNYGAPRETWFHVSRLERVDDPKPTTPGFGAQP